MARRPITTRMPLNEPEANPDWQAGQEWVRTNALAKVLEARRAFHEKTAQDAANYILAQGGSPEAAQAAYREVMSGFARSELMATSVLPIGPKGAGAASAPAREAQLALPAPRYAPGSAASRAANEPMLTLNERRAGLGLPSEETAAMLRRPVETGPVEGSAASRAASAPALSLEEQRTALGLPPAADVRARSMPDLPRGPATGSAADVGAQRNAQWSSMTEAEKRRALGLPAQTEADVRAAELARMADEGPVAERSGRPSAVGEYRMAGETAPRQAPSQPVRAEVGPALETTGRELVPYTPPGVPAALPSRQGGAGSTAARPWEGPALGTTSFRPTDLPLIAAMGGLGAAAAGSMLIPRSANQGPASAPSAPSETGQPVGGFDRMADTQQPVGGFDRMPSAPARAPVVQAARAATQPSRETVQTPPQRTAPSTGSSFLDNIFGGDYQSTGQKVREDKKVNWGDPELASDFFRADKARMEMGEGRASGGRTGSPKPDAVHKALEIIHHLIMKG